MTGEAGTGESARACTIRELYELVAALDRRVPQVRRVGEVAIARAARALKTAALRRIEELEAQDSGSSVRDGGQAARG